MICPHNGIRRQSRGMKIRFHVEAKHNMLLTGHRPLCVFNCRTNPLLSRRTHMTWHCHMFVEETSFALHIVYLFLYWKVSCILRTTLCMFKMINKVSSLVRRCCLISLRRRRCCLISLRCRRYCSLEHPRWQVNLYISTDWCWPNLCILMHLL